MKSKKFNSQEVQAIIAGNKTMFREVVKKTKNEIENYNLPDECGTELLLSEAPYKVGQEIFVEGQEPPIALKIKSVKVERLADINEADCLKEGIGYTGGWNGEDYDDGEYYFGKLTESKDGMYYTNEMFKYAEHVFEAYWNSTQKKQEDEWKANPWVFVYEFEVINFKK